MSVNSKMTAIADAIRNLLDISGTMGLDAMASNISSITKRGAVAGMISTKSERYIIPAGYHNGNGSVGIADAEQAKIIAENIKNGVTILGVSGTASGDIYAIIAVTYPAGSTCTCSDGTTTLTARDTSGKALFNVPSAGTWTVSCTDGSSTVSKSVTITATGQVESVELSYRLYLYKNGDEFNDVTGGWVTYSSRDNPELKISNRNNQLVITGELRAASNCGGTAQKVQIGSANTISFTGTVDKISGTYPIYIALFDTKADKSTSASVVARAKFPSVGTYNGYSVLDLSAVSAGEYYVGFIVEGDDGSSFTVINKLSIDDLWID